MSVDPLDELFAQLGTPTSEEAVAALVTIGMPAIERLVEGRERGKPVVMPAAANGRAFVDSISSLYHQVAKACPAAFVDYVLARPAHPMVRAMIGALGATHDPRVLPFLIESSRDKEREIRYSAVRALKDLGDAQATPALLERLKDRYDLAFSAALRALGACGDAQALPALEDMAGKGKNESRRGDATAAADSIRRRLGMEAIPRRPGRELTVSLDESRLKAKQRVGHTLVAHVKPGDKVSEQDRLASVVTEKGESDLRSIFGGEVVSVEQTPDRISVTVRQLVAFNL